MAAPPAIIVSRVASTVTFPVTTHVVAAHMVFQAADAAGIEHRPGVKVRTRGQQMWRAQVENRLVGFFLRGLSDRQA